MTNLYKYAKSNCLSKYELKLIENRIDEINELIASTEDDQLIDALDFELGALIVKLERSRKMAAYIEATEDLRKAL